MKSLNKTPKQKDLSTLQRLESSRSNKDTIFQPEWLKPHKTIRYLKRSQVASNEVLNAGLFDEIIKIKQVGNVVHAIGLTGKKQNVLVIEI